MKNFNSFFALSLFFPLLWSTSGWAKPFPDCVADDGVKICRNAHSDSLDRAGSAFDLYVPNDLPASQTFRPIVLIHGGCFSSGSKDDVAPLAKELAHAGFVAMAIDYTLATDTAGSYPDVLNDLRTHLHWLSSEQADQMKIKVDWIGAYGESSGGTLASYLGTRHLNADRPLHKSAVDAVVDFYGRTDMTRPRPPGQGTDCASLFLHASRATELTRFKEASVQPTTDIPPAHFLIAHGTADQQVEPWHSHHLQDALRAVGVADNESRLLEFPGQGHGFTGDALVKARAAAVDFFRTEEAQAGPAKLQIWIKKPVAKPR